MTDEKKKVTKQSARESGEKFGKATSSALTPLRLIFMVIASVVIALSISYFLLYYLEKLPLLGFSR